MVGVRRHSSNNALYNDPSIGRRPSVNGANNGVDSTEGGNTGAGNTGGGNTGGVNTGGGNTGGVNAGGANTGGGGRRASDPLARQALVRHGFLPQEGPPLPAQVCALHAYVFYCSSNGVSESV